jgi:fructose-bisphosphate aldolase class II
MTVATLAEVLQPALKHGYAVGGLVCLGWEDMRAYVAAAEAEGAPVILQAGQAAASTRRCRAGQNDAPSGRKRERARRAASRPWLHRRRMPEALDSGFTSLMFDGSRKPLAENIAETPRIAEMAHGLAFPAKGEIGFVGYDGGEASAGTDPQEAAQFARETGVDAMAISVGNVHLQQESSDGLDEERIRAIEALGDTPLVIHGGSGVPAGAAHPSGAHIENLQVQHRHRAAHGVSAGAANRRSMPILIALTGCRSSKKPITRWNRLRVL